MNQQTRNRQLKIMKKTSTKIMFASLILLSMVSFIYLNTSNPDFPLFSIGSEIKSFDVPSSTLPDVEAVKNTLIFIKEMFSL